jgi:hypothetical protein
MYPNLRAEMARKLLKTKDIAAAINSCEKTAFNKLTGKSPFDISEAWKIRNTYFPNISLDILFSKEAVLA